MLWLADENINRAIVDELRHAGHDVVYAADERDKRATVCC